jgi:hypothetical protein
MIMNRMWPREVIAEIRPVPGARDTELLNYIGSYGQTPPAPPECQFNHWGLTVYLAPELAKQFEPPADYLAFAEFMEQMLPQCRVFMSACPGTRGEDPQKVLQAFIDHFMTLSPDKPVPNFRRYGHKGHGQPYPIWFLKCFCNFIEGTLPGRRQGRGSAVAAAPRSGKPIRPAHPTAFDDNSRRQER